MARRGVGVDGGEEGGEEGEKQHSTTRLRGGAGVLRVTRKRGGRGAKCAECLARPVAAVGGSCDSSGKWCVCRSVRDIRVFRAALGDVTRSRLLFFRFPFLFRAADRPIERFDPHTKGES